MFDNQRVSATTEYLKNGPRFVLGKAIELSSLHNGPGMSGTKQHHVEKSQQKIGFLNNGLYVIM